MKLRRVLELLPILFMGSMIAGVLVLICLYGTPRGMQPIHRDQIVRPMDAGDGNTIILGTPPKEGGTR